MTPDAPIGIFDSGIGGLTVAHAIATRLPHERLVYFGDTAHLPYGDKSEAAIQAYSIRIADVLLQKNCKVIVIACNSASSAAYELLKEYVRHQAKVINVIDPMVEYVAKHHAHQKVGLIGTKRTVLSNVYQQKLEERQSTVDLHALATPLLAPMIEEGFSNSRISHDLIDQYLSNDTLSDIRALVLACTHYPLIKQEVRDYFQGNVDILDSSEVAAQALDQYLTQQSLKSPAQGTPAHEFLVSDYTDSFEASTKIFFGEHVHLTRHPLWARE